MTITPAVLRPADVGDLPHLFRLEAAYLQRFEPDSYEKWLHAADRNLELWTANWSRAVTAEVDGHFAGLELWMPERAGAGATLVTIHVHPDFRGGGLGAQLLRRFRQDARAAGHARLLLGVHRENPARRLYERAGFVPAGQDGPYDLMELVG